MPGCAANDNRPVCSTTRTSAPGASPAILAHKWPDEPGFGAAVSSVLDNKATSVTINISSTTLHSVNGSLGKKLAGLGFELGVSSETSDAVSLHMVAKFPERSRWR